MSAHLLTFQAIETYAVLSTLMAIGWKTALVWKSEGWVAGIIIACALPMIYAIVLIASVGIAGLLRGI